MRPPTQTFESGTLDFPPVWTSGGEVHTGTGRAELRRLARQWQLRIRTVARDDRVGVTRIDEHPWDDDERAAIQRVNDALGDTRH